MRSGLVLECGFGAMASSLLAPHRLAGCFESLGDGCEFGLLQRFCGLEVLGLLRFASLPLEHLLTLLDTRFGPLLSPECVSVFLPEGDREWWGRVAGFGIASHAGRWWTGDTSEADSEAAALAGERRRIPFLTRKLLEDLDTPHKIFVRRDLGRTVEDMAALARGLRSFGDHALLWIDIAPTPDRVGDVEKLGDGFARGFLGGFSNNAAPSVANTAVWLRLLETAMILLRPKLAIGLMSGETAAHRIIVPYETDDATDIILTSEVSAPFGDDLAMQHRFVFGSVHESRPMLSASVAELRPSPFHVVSCYIWLPDSYQGSVHIAVAGETVWTWKADTDRRQCWQRIATSFHGAKTPGTVQICLTATGQQNDCFYSAHWRVEPGVAPSDGLPDFPTAG